MNIVKALSLSLWFVLLATTTRADNPMPPVPEGGFLVIISEFTCTITDYRAEGRCELKQDKMGNQYIVFSQGGDVKVIRQITGETTHVDIWVETGFGTT